jgi:hypothetical protein
MHETQMVFRVIVEARLLKKSRFLIESDSHGGFTSNGPSPRKMGVLCDLMILKRSCDGRHRSENRCRFSISVSMRITLALAFMSAAADPAILRQPAQGKPNDGGIQQ